MKRVFTISAAAMVMAVSACNGAGTGTQVTDSTSLPVDSASTKDSIVVVADTVVSADTLAK